MGFEKYPAGWVRHFLNAAALITSLDFSAMLGKKTEDTTDQNRQKGNAKPSAPAV